MKFTNRYNLPDALFSALSSDWYSQPGRISVTGLISSPRIAQLKARHRDELEEWTRDLVAPLDDLRGSAPFKRRVAGALVSWALHHAQAGGKA